MPNNLTLLKVKDGDDTTPYTTRATTLGELKAGDFREDFSISARAEILVNGETKPDSYILSEGDTVSSQVAASSKSK